MPTVTKNDQEMPAAGRSLLDEIVRGGTRRMLAAALEAKVAAYIRDQTDQLDEDGRRLVVRNGRYDPRAGPDVLGRGRCARIADHRQGTD